MLYVIGAYLIAGAIFEYVSVAPCDKPGCKCWMVAMPLAVTFWPLLAIGAFKLVRKP